MAAKPLRLVLLSSRKRLAGRVRAKKAIWRKQICVWIGKMETDLAQLCASEEHEILNSEAIALFANQVCKIPHKRMEIEILTGSICYRADSFYQNSLQVLPETQ